MCNKCDNTGWIREWSRFDGNVEWDLCDCGIETEPTDFTKQIPVLTLIDRTSLQESIAICNRIARGDF